MVDELSNLKKNRVSNYEISFGYFILASDVFVQWQEGKKIINKYVIFNCFAKDFNAHVVRCQNVLFSTSLEGLFTLVQYNTV